MRTISLKLIILFLVVATNLYGKELPGITVISEQEEINVVSLDLFTVRHEVSGVNTDTEARKIAFRIREGDKVSDLSVTAEVNGKNKKIDLKDNLIVSTLDWSSFFSGSQTYSITIPGNCSFKMNYKLNSNNTLFLSEISKSGSFDSKAYQCVLSLPDSLMISTNLGVTYSGKMNVIDSNSFNGRKEIYCLVHPKGSEPNRWFSNWFNTRIASKAVLNPTLIPKSLDSIQRYGTRESLAAACFRFVQHEISYVAIENGINGYVPRPPNQILTNKMGDCKDMANLLCTLLKNYGFEVYLGISKTNAIKDTFNFPSLNMANHMIAVLKLNEEFVFLDATEDMCLYGDPSFQILETEAFLINHPTNFFVAVPGKLKHRPSMNCAYVVRKTEMGVTMNIRINTTGKLNGYFFALKLEQKLTDENLSKYFTKLFPFPIQLKESRVTDTTGVFLLETTISPNHLSKIGTNSYMDGTVFPSVLRFSEFLSGSDEPSFEADYIFEFDGINVPKAVDMNTLSCVKQQVIKPTDFQFTIKVSKENCTEKGDPSKFWKSFISKPILIP